MALDNFYFKEYYQMHKTSIDKLHREYVKKNKEKVKEYQRRYYLAYKSSRQCMRCGNPCTGSLCWDCFTKNHCKPSKARALLRYQKNNMGCKLETKQDII